MADLTLGSELILGTDLEVDNLTILDGGELIGGTFNVTCVNLTINTGGSYTHTSGNITVTQICHVSGTMSCGSATCSFGNGYATGIASGTLNVDGGNFTGSTGTTTAGSLRFVGTSTVNLSNGTYDVNSNYLAVATYFNIGMAASTITFSNPGTLNFILARATSFSGSGYTFGDVTFSGAFTETLAAGAPAGFTNLTVHAGCGFNTSTGSNFALTVIEKTIIHGILQVNASAVSLGSGYSADFALEVRSGGNYLGGTGTQIIGSMCVKTNGTFTYSSGTTTFNSSYLTENGRVICIEATTTISTPTNSTAIITSPIDTFIRINAVVQNFYNLTINTPNTIGVSTLTDTGITIGNNLTITQGKLLTQNHLGTTSNGITVTGNTSITGTLEGVSSTMGFGNVTINLGGTYLATTEITTVNGNWTNSGTFTHRSGRVIMTGTPKTLTSGGSAFYDLITNVTTTQADDLTVSNNLTGSGTVTTPNFIKLISKTINDSALTIKRGISARIQITGNGVAQPLEDIDLISIPQPIPIKNTACRWENYSG